jgi:hypothetical protein
MSENRALRRVIGPKVDKVRGEIMTLPNYELCSLSPLPHIASVIRPGTMLLGVHVAW